MIKNSFNIKLLKVIKKIIRVTFFPWHPLCSLFGQGLITTNNIGKEAGKMKKLTILIITTAILCCWISSTYAADILGYPIVPKQAKFYLIILTVIGASMAMVATAHFSFWLVDLKKRRKEVTVKPAFNKGLEAFGGQLAAVAQPAK